MFLCGLTSSLGQTWTLCSHFIFAIAISFVDSDSCCYAGFCWSFTYDLVSRLHHSFVIYIYFAQCLFPAGFVHTSVFALLSGCPRTCFSFPFSHFSCVHQPVCFPISCWLHTAAWFGFSCFFLPSTSGGL